MATYAVGQRMTASLVENLANSTGKLVYRAERTTASTATSGTTEQGVIRIDGMTLTAGYAYLVTTGNMRYDLSVTTDRAKATLRYSTSGSATNASTEIGRWEVASNLGDLNSGGPVVGWIFPSSTVTNASVRLSIVRAAGTGTVTAMADSGHGIQLFVIAYGTDPGDTGIDE